ncbi:MAG TPA: ABC transporter permease [Pyrinomonadaceae bacterium]|nr:ABC transporter permease [Pyrinomonadaceae bacterium]
MSFLDILRLALRNLREAKLRVALTTMGVIVGVAVIVTMVSFGLGLQRNTVERFNELDLFNEINVFGRNLSTLVTTELNKRGGGEGAEKAGEGEAERKPERALDDAALEEIASIPGVAYVEPSVTFTAYVRFKGHTQRLTVGGARVPNSASRFQHFSAGAMITAPESREVVVDSYFLKVFGIKEPAEAVGQTVELLSPNDRRKREDSARPDEEARGKQEDDDSLSFFGIPLEDGDDGEGGGDASAPVAGLVAHPFRIAGVLQNEVENAPGSPGGNRRFRGLMPEANIYVTLAFAREWKSENRDMLNEVALQLARQSGAIGAGETEGYQSATVRVNDPAAASEVFKTLEERGFNAFGLFNELDEIRKVFLVINSALGLLGGISLLVASFGIANTMIMSIFERTREIGIMKAIGAEDFEIKLIFFVEAAVIGLMGGSAGALAAWGIDKLANQLAYQFLLAPQGASFIDFFSLPPWLWLGAILFAILVSVIAALYPAARAARIDPVKALRHD